MRQNLLSPVLLVVSDPPGILVTTKTGGCYNVEILPVWRSPPGFAMFPVTHFSSAARWMWAWPICDVMGGETVVLRGCISQ